MGNTGGQRERVVEILAAVNWSPAVVAAEVVRKWTFNNRADGSEEEGEKPRKPKQLAEATAHGGSFRRGLDAIKLKLWSRNYFYLLTSTCSIYFEIKLFIIYSVIHVYLASM